jgi:DNA-binding SARP family transcriptional activator
MNDQDRSRGIQNREVRVTLLGGFSVVVDSRAVTLPFSTQRVLVALALRPQDRSVLLATLYPDGRRSQGSASLRSALWRARRATGHGLVEAQGQRLRLAASVDVDLRTWTRHARSLAFEPRIDADTASSELIEWLSRELLPAWGEEWLVLERQRWDNLRLHTLELLTEALTAAGRHLDALEAGLAAVAIEPYRETAHRALIKAYIAEGNCASAVAQYHQYRRLLARELGVRPTAHLQALVQGLTDR